MNQSIQLDIGGAAADPSELNQTAESSGWQRRPRNTLTVTLGKGPECAEGGGRIFSG
jgi:hypothetical protein